MHTTTTTATATAATAITKGTKVYYGIISARFQVFMLLLNFSWKNLFYFNLVSIRSDFF